MSAPGRHLVAGDQKDAVVIHRTRLVIRTDQDPPVSKDHGHNCALRGWGAKKNELYRPLGDPDLKLKDNASKLVPPPARTVDLEHSRPSKPRVDLVARYLDQANSSKKVKSTTGVDPSSSNGAEGEGDDLGERGSKQQSGSKSKGDPDSDSKRSKQKNRYLQVKKWADRPLFSDESLKVRTRSSSLGMPILQAFINESANRIRLTRSVCGDFLFGYPLDLFREENINAHNHRHLQSLATQALNLTPTSAPPPAMSAESRAAAAAAALAAIDDLSSSRRHREQAALELAQAGGERFGGEGFEGGDGGNETGAGGLQAPKRAAEWEAIRARVAAIEHQRDHVGRCATPERNVANVGPLPSPSSRVACWRSPEPKLNSASLRQMARMGPASQRELLSGDARQSEVKPITDIEDTPASPPSRLGPLSPRSPEDQPLEDPRGSPNTHRYRFSPAGHLPQSPVLLIHSTEPPPPTVDVEISRRTFASTFRHSSAGKGMGTTLSSFGLKHGATAYARDTRDRWVTGDRAQTPPRVRLEPSPPTAGVHGGSSTDRGWFPAAGETQGTYFVSSPPKLSTPHDIESSCPSASSGVNLKRKIQPRVPLARFADLSPFRSPVPSPSSRGNANPPPAEVSIPLSSHVRRRRALRLAERLYEQRQEQSRTAQEEFKVRPPLSHDQLAERGRGGLPGTELEVFNEKEKEERGSEPELEAESISSSSPAMSPSVQQSFPFPPPTGRSNDDEFCLSPAPPNRMRTEPLDTLGADGTTSVGVKNQNDMPLARRAASAGHLQDYLPPKPESSLSKRKHKKHMSVCLPDKSETSPEILVGGPESPRMHPPPLPSSLSLEATLPPEGPPQPMSARRTSVVSLAVAGTANELAARRGVPLPHRLGGEELTGEGAVRRGSTIFQKITPRGRSFAHQKQSSQASCASPLLSPPTTETKKKQFKQSGGRPQQKEPKSPMSVPGAEVSPSRRREKKHKLVDQMSQRAAMATAAHIAPSHVRQPGAGGDMRHRRQPAPPPPRTAGRGVLGLYMAHSDSAVRPLPHRLPTFLEFSSRSRPGGTFGQETAEERDAAQAQSGATGAPGGNSGERGGALRAIRNHVARLDAELRKRDRDFWKKRRADHLVGFEDSSRAQRARGEDLSLGVTAKRDKGVVGGASAGAAARGKGAKQGPMRDGDLETSEFGELYEQFQIIIKGDDPHMDPTNRLRGSFESFAEARQTLLGSLEESLLAMEFNRLQGLLRKSRHFDPRHLVGRQTVLSGALRKMRCKAELDTLRTVTALPGQVEWLYDLMETAHRLAREEVARTPGLLAILEYARMVTEIGTPFTFDMMLEVLECLQPEAFTPNVCAVVMVLLEGATQAPEDKVSALTAWFEAKGEMPQGLQNHISRRRLEAIGDGAGPQNAAASPNSDEPT